MLFYLVKMVLKSVKSVDTVIITGMILHTPPHLKSLETNVSNMNRDIFQTTTNQMMTLLSSRGSESLDKMDELCSTRLILGLFDGNAS